MGNAAGAVVLVVAVLLGVGAPPAPSAPTPTVTCDKIVLGVRSGEGGSGGGYRVVLDVVSVPPPYRPQVVRSLGYEQSEQWPYWSKAGLVVRGGSPPVSVSVPAAWRNRAAILWGNTPVVSALRIASCPASTGGKAWNAYAGGFFLRSPSACVPLIFRVGGRSATVRFGVGRRCGAAP